MANKLTTPLVEGPDETEYYRYMMDTPESLTSADKESLFFLRKDEPLYLDVETHSYTYENIRTAQLYQEHWPKAIIFDTNDIAIRDLHTAIKDNHVVAHMLTMELSTFQNDTKPEDVLWSEYFPGIPFEKHSDTFLLARQALFNKVDGFGLDKVAKYVHGTDYYHDYAVAIGASDPVGYKKFMQKSFLDTPKSDKRSQPLHKEQLVYGALDVMVMPKIYKAFKEEEKKFIVKLDYLFIDRCVKYQHVGLPLDEDKWELHTNNLTNTREKCTQLFPEGFNPRSYKQVRALLNSVESDDQYFAQVVDGSDMVVCPVGVEGGTPEGLIEAAVLYRDDPDVFLYRKRIAEALREYRSAAKRMEALKAYKEQHERFGRVKGYISPRTISGRIASDEVNMTNIPRSLKDCFGYKDTPEDSRFLIYADYSQLELRMLAAVLREEVMISKFMNDEDLHVFAATQVYEKAPEVITKAERFIGKFFNFSGGYGAGVARLCTMLIKEAGIYMSEEDMRPLHRRWKKTFPAMDEWHRRNGRSKTNEDVTLLGRMYKAKLYTDLNAIKMQGSSAEVFKLAHIYMEKNMPGIRTGAAVHDSYIHLADNIVEAQNVGFVTVWCMIVAWFEVLQNSLYPTLKMPTEALIGKNWGEIDNEGKFSLKYRADGNHKQYLAAKSYVVQGTLLENMAAFDEIQCIEQ